MIREKQEKFLQIINLSRPETSDFIGTRPTKKVEFKHKYSVYRETLKKVEYLLHRQPLQTVHLGFHLSLKCLILLQNHRRRRTGRSCPLFQTRVVQGHGHVTLSFNLKCKTIGLPFEVCRVS